jgi:hypothetical protein
MSSHFDSLSTANIEAKLQKDLLEHEDRIVRIGIIVAFILMYFFRGVLGYWLKFGLAIPKNIDFTPIQTELEPDQTNYTEEESKQKTFIYTSLLNGHKIKVIPQAHYKLSGMVVAYNYSFVFISEFFDSAALYDLGASWGQLADKKLYNKYFKSYSAKTELSGSRILWTQMKKYPAPVTMDYATTHFSHSHLVPANKNIMAALLSLKLWDKFEIEGDLIDMVYPGIPAPDDRIQTYHTSMSRNDPPSGDRGNGSCETVYVTRVKIGSRVYE